MGAAAKHGDVAGVFPMEVHCGVVHGVGAHQHR